MGQGSQPRNYGTTGNPANPLPQFEGEVVVPVPKGINISRGLAIFLAIIIIAAVLVTVVVITLPIQQPPTKMQSLIDNSTTTSPTRMPFINSDSHCSYLRSNYQDIPLADYSGPITISKGGVYSGNWRSTSTNIPAVFLNTFDTVYIVNSHIRSAGDLISIFSSSLTGKIGNLTISNCYGYAEDPMTSGIGRGRFAKLSYGSNVNISNNYLESTAGIYLYKSTCPVSVMYNCVHNLGGLVSSVTPNGLCAIGIKAGGTYCSANFLQLNQIKDNSNVEIAWNEMVNTPYQSAGEDHISIYQTSGTAASPILIHDNYFQGIYPNAPDTVYMTGAGMNIGDSAATYSSEANTGYVKCYNNQLVSISTQGISQGSGSNNFILNNRIISSGVFVDNGIVKRFKYAHVGIQLWDYFNLGQAAVHNNTIANNYVGYMGNVGMGGALHRSDYGLNLTLTNAHVNNTGPLLNYTVKLEDEAAEYALWKSKLLANGIWIGLFPF